MCSQGSVLTALVREVKGGAIAVWEVKHRHLQVLWLVQRMLPATRVGVCVWQERLHLTRLAPSVEAGCSADASPAGSPTLWPTVPQRLCWHLKTKDLWDYHHECYQMKPAEELLRIVLITHPQGNSQFSPEVFRSFIWPTLRDYKVVPFHRAEKQM